MTSRTKMQKKTKYIFTIIPDRLIEDSLQQLNQTQLHPQNQLLLQSFQFPLNQEIHEIHHNPQTTQLSAYIQHLENQVKSITNKIQLEYHQARQTVLYIGQSTNFLNNCINRKKIDDQFNKIGIVRKYSPLQRHLNLQLNDLDEQQLGKDAGDLIIDQIKHRVQLQWESQISDEIEKQRKRLKQLQKKRLKQLQQIDKDFQKIMKKRKANKQLLGQFKSQQSLKSVQNYDKSLQIVESSSIKTPKKIQKRQKIQRRASQRNKQKASVHESRQKNSVGDSQIESCSVINNLQNDGKQAIGDDEAHIVKNLENGVNLEDDESSDNNLKMNLLQVSNQNHWYNGQIPKQDNGQQNEQKKGQNQQ